MRRAGLLLLRLGLAGVFIYAGGLKVYDPLAFADSIAGFHLLPHELIHPLALGLPVYEILLGALLLLPRTARPAALGISLLCLVFAGALLASLGRGLPIDCGCFGRGAWTSNGWLLLARDGVLLLAAVTLYATAAPLKQVHHTTAATE